MKRCFRCGAEKPLSDFYRHKGMADGHLNKCKECTKVDVKTRRKVNPAVQEYDRLRGNRQSAEYLRQYRLDNPNKYKAHSAVNSAIRAGRLIRPEHCEECGGTLQIEGHHDDYQHPLIVRWLCSLCHSRWHVENGEGLNP